MFSSKDLKGKALISLKNNWINPVVILLLFLLITIVVSSILSIIILLFSFIPTFICAHFLEEANASIIGKNLHYIFSFALTLLLIPLSLGYINYFLMFAKSQKPKFINLFDGYKKSFSNSIVAGILMLIYVSLWSLLLIVPGIIKSFSYAMTFYIIADNPNIGAIESLKRSKAMMHGHKWELFKLELSFLGWGILSILTFGIGFIFLLPYMETTKAHFYSTLKENFEEEVPESIILEEF